jgi:Sec-independent protein translocase protein TatA
LTPSLGSTWGAAAAPLARPDLGFLNMGLPELIMLGTIALLVFGGRLPETMRTMGRTYARFRRGLEEAVRPVREEVRRVGSIAQDAAYEARYPDAAPREPLPPRTPEGESVPPPGPAPTPTASRPGAARPAPRASGVADEPPPV